MGFEAQVQSLWTKDQKNQFKKWIGWICGWLEVNEAQIKGYISDSVAQVMLLLVCMKIRVGKREFLRNLKPQVKEKWILPKIGSIKKLNCYRLLKKVFRENIES